MESFLSKTFFKIFAQAPAYLLVFTVVFTVFEPATLGAETFTESLTVQSEISFATPASNITLTPSIDVTAGGTAGGGTQVVVKTNNATGYTMTLMASSSVGMIGVASSSNSIPAYVPAVALVPDYSFTVPANKAYFGYTTEASTTADLADAFKDAAGLCNSPGGSDTVDKCWINASSTAFTIINRSGPTAGSGATTTLKLQVTIDSNPSPLIPNDTYVATTTLTALVN